MQRIQKTQESKIRLVEKSVLQSHVRNDSYTADITVSKSVQIKRSAYANLTQMIEKLLQWVVYLQLAWCLAFPLRITKRIRPLGDNVS